MEAEVKSPWFQLERARRKQRAEAAQHGREETERRWMEAAIERRRKDAIKREEVDKWAKEDINRQWNETVRERIKRRDTILQITDNWNFMLSQQENIIKNRDDKFDNADDNSVTRVAKPNALEENDFQANSNKNIYLKSGGRKDENSENYTEGSTNYKSNIIEKQHEIENVQDFPESFPNQFNIHFEKKNEDYTEKSIELPHYKLNKKDEKDNTETSTKLLYPKNTDMDNHITQKTITATLTNYVKENEYKNKNFPHIFPTDSLYANAEIVHNTKETKPANISNDDGLKNDRTPLIVSDGASDEASDEVELFV